MSSKQKVRLSAPNGVVVSVAKAKEQKLRGQGFTDAKASPKPASAK